MRFRTLWLFMALLAGVVAGGAQAGNKASNFYIRGDFGKSWARDAEITDDDFSSGGIICGDAGCTSPGQLDEIGTSLLAGAGFGYRFSSLLRAELSYSYRWGYDLEQLDQLVLPDSFEADITSHTVMANIYISFWEFLAGIRPIKPFLGGGIGWARNEIEGFTITNVPVTGGSNTLSGGIAQGLAWQLMGGVTIGLSNSVNLDLTYRYIDAGEIEAGSGLLGGSGALAGTTHFGATGELTAHEAFASFRYRF